MTAAAKPATFATLGLSLGLSLGLGLGLFAAPVRAEVELGFYGGLQEAPHSSIHHSILGDDFVRWEGRSFQMPPQYGLRATWWRSETWGYGVDFNHVKAYADDPASYGYDRLEFTNGLNIVTLNVWRRWPNAGRLTPYAGAGLGVAVPHVDIKPAAQAHTFGYQLTGPAAQIVLGASYEMNARWSVFGEYKGTYSQNKADLDSGGTLSTDIITNALNLGVSLRF